MSNFFLGFPVSRAKIAEMIEGYAPPISHHGRHEDGGDDEIDCTGLTGAGGGTSLIDRGDPAANDKTLSDFTTDNAYHDLNLSSIVPAGATWILLKVVVMSSTIPAYIRFRKKGNSNSINVAVADCIQANLSHPYQFLCPCDADRVIEYYASNSTWSSIQLSVSGWIS